MKNYINLDDLLNMSNELQKKKEVVIKVPRINKNIKCKLMNSAEYTDIISSNETDKDVELVYNYMLEPNLKDDILIEKLGCKSNPYDVVRKIFNHAEVTEIAEIILKESGFKGAGITKVFDDIKN